MEKVTGIREPFSEEALFRMNKGVEFEPRVREEYERQNMCIVDEVGLAVPKFDFRIGGSSDGRVRGQNRLIEIKCPKFLYPNLKKGIEMGVPTAGIKDDHKYQMLGAMASLNSGVCDYVVYAWGTGDFVQVEYKFDGGLWWNNVYPGLVSFVTEFDLNTGPFLPDDKRVIEASSTS